MTWSSWLWKPNKNLTLNLMRISCLMIWMIIMWLPVLISLRKKLNLMVKPCLAMMPYANFILNLNKRRELLRVKFVTRILRIILWLSCVSRTGSNWRICGCSWLSAKWLSLIHQLIRMPKRWRGTYLTIAIIRSLFCNGRRWFTKKW